MNKPEPKRRPGRPKGTHAPPRFTVRRVVHLTPEQDAILKRTAAEAGISVGALVRYWIG